MHKLLQLLPDLPTDQWQSAGVRYLAKSGHDLPEQEQAALLGEVLAIMQDPEFAALFGPGSRAEVPMTGTVPSLGDAVVIDGQVDRIVVTGSQVHLVDYKTNRPAPVEMQKVPQAYVAQMALYRSLAESIIPGRSVICSLLWTDGPHRLTLPNSVLDAALEAIRARLGRQG